MGEQIMTAQDRERLWEALKPTAAALDELRRSRSASIGGVYFLQSAAQVAAAFEAERAILDEMERLHIQAASIVTAFKPADPLVSLVEATP
jgi:hypothetical protein